MKAFYSVLSVGNLRSRVLIAGACASAVVLVGANAFGDTASSIEGGFYPIGSYAQWDNSSGDYPVITAVGSMPGTFGGHIYTSWSVFAEDSTGSLDLFAASTTLTTLTANAGATLNVGDQLNVAGQWGPFHQIPELSFVTTPASNNYFQTISTGNAVGPRPVRTVSQLNALGSAPSNDLTVAGFYMEVDNVTILSPSNGFTVLPGFTNGIAQETYTMTDNTGSMTMFDWTTSYSSCTLLAGTPIGPSVQYNVKGFVSYNTGGPLEFTPFSMVAVPEPSTIALVGAAGLLLALRRRR